MSPIVVPYSSHPCRCTVSPVSYVIVRLGPHPIAVPLSLPYGNTMVSLPYVDVQ